MKAFVRILSMGSALSVVIGCTAVVEAQTCSSGCTNFATRIVNYPTSGGIPPNLVTVGWRPVGSGGRITFCSGPESTSDARQLTLTDAIDQNGAFISVSSTGQLLKDVSLCTSNSSSTDPNVVDNIVSGLQRTCGANLVAVKPIQSNGHHLKISTRGNADLVTVLTPSIVVCGGAGNDTLQSWPGNVTANGISLWGGTGNDTLSFNHVAGSFMALEGEDGDDTLTNGNAVGTSNGLNGGFGNDKIENWGDAQLQGGPGNDTLRLRGTKSTGRLIGQDGNDTLTGRSGYSATCDGGAGTDTCTLCAVNTSC